jgi:cytosine deaminase
MSSSIDDLEKRIAAFAPDPSKEHDPFILACVKEAFAALQEGNFPVGAVLVKDGQVIESGHNHVFHPYFRSDLHAEMSVMTAAEDRLRGDHTEHSGIIVYSSLEPCLMCAARLLNGGVRSVFYGAPDPKGGIGAVIDHLPVAWENMREGTRTKFAPAPCSDELKKLCADLLAPVADQLCALLEERG